MSSRVRTPSQSQMLQSRGDGPSTAANVPCVEVLRTTPLFAGLSDEQLRILAPLCRQMPMRKGRIFFSRGDETREVYVVLDGQVCLEQELVVGQRLPPRTLLVERVGPNGVFGLCALITPRRTNLTARCTGDTAIIAINSDDLGALIKVHSAIGLVVMENAFKIAYERLMCSHHRIITELGLPTMYEAYRNY
jgi:CRP-like cAMP-binding protein